jgi:hypothetical protein
MICQALLIYDKVAPHFWILRIGLADLYRSENEKKLAEMDSVRNEEINSQK